MRSSVLHKNDQLEDYNKVYADRPNHQINIIEEEPLMDELVG